MKPTSDSPLHRWSNLISEVPIRRWMTVALLAWVGYGIFLAFHFAPVASGSDSSGYLNSASLLLKGRLVTELRTVPELTADSPFATVPLGFVPEEGSDRLIPTYPIGMPILFAVAQFVVGPVAGISVVGVMGAMMAVWLCYAIGREIGLSRPLSVASAAVLALNPIFIFIAVQPLSDVLATTWCAAAIYAALRSRRGASWAVVAGAAAAMAVLVRPTNLLLFPALLMLLPGCRAVVRFGLGGLPGAIALGVYQHELYGSAFRSGYGDIWQFFRWSNLWPTAAHYAHWLPRFLPAVLLVSFIGALRSWRNDGRNLLMLFLWAVPILVFYAYYDVTREVWWTLRFLLPACPPIILAGALGLERMLARSTEPKTFLIGASAAVLVAWSAAQTWYWDKPLDITGPSRAEPAYREIAVWTGENLPPNSIVACMFLSGAIHYYTPLPILRWDMVTADEFRKFSTSIDLASRPVYAVLFFEEQPRVFEERLPGSWTKIHETRRAAVWQLTAPKPAPWVN